MPLLKICLSHATFQGFSRIIDTSQFDSIQSISQYMKKQLIAYLTTAELENLVFIASSLNLSCADYEYYGQICEKQPNILYLRHDYIETKYT